MNGIPARGDDLNVDPAEPTMPLVLDVWHPAGEARLGPQPIYANAFAAALLMPRSLVRALRKSGQSPAQLARFFRVSEQAMNYRLQNLGID
jgi:hypothetical protein